MSQPPHYRSSPGSTGAGGNNIHVGSASSSSSSSSSAAAAAHLHLHNGLGGAVGGIMGGGGAGIGGAGGPSVKINMNLNHHHLDQYSRSLSFRIRRFLRTNFAQIRNHPSLLNRRIRFGIFIPFVLFVIWLLLSINSMLIRLIVGPKKDPNVLEPPYYINRGNLTNVDMRPTEGAGMMTAILLNWSRLQNLKEIVDNLCPYEMFKEIMIWNNKVDIHLEEKIFNCPKVRVYNSPDNMFFVARYMACAMASSPYCYFQDDDWQIYHLRAMYANFLRFPQFVHTDTNSDVWALTNWHWCFYEDEVNMHACFSWLGTGAMTTRENVVKFLKQASVTNMDSLEFAYGDMYYSTFLNQVPYQLENYLYEMPQDFAFSAGSSGKQRNKDYMHRAARKLWDALERKDPLFEREELHPTFLERDVRSPCLDDRCLIISNKHPFADVRMFKYRPYIDIEQGEILHRQYEVPDIYVQNPFSKAVDGLDDTAYKSTENIKKGDYVGLDMLMLIDRPIEYRLLYQMGDDWIKNVRIELSQDGTTYLPIIPQTSCRTVRNRKYKGPVSKEVQKAMLNRPIDDRPLVFAEEEQARALTMSNRVEEQRAIAQWDPYTDYGWRTECKFVVHSSHATNTRGGQEGKAPKGGYRFIRIVSGRDESFPFVLYDLGWKVI
ncbi:hypothetical protein BGW41_003465 [Actinomortierella wolfii]|nr:hypothetical protein BGW41_003465 [Actinomortierella wolfii]